MFDTELFIEEVRKRPGLYLSRYRGEPGSKNLLWEEVGRAMFSDWPQPHHVSQRMDRVRELRKKWKSVRDNFLRDVKGTNGKKKPYIYHDLLSFLLPHIDPRRWHRDSATEEDDPKPEQRRRAVPELEPIAHQRTAVKAAGEPALEGQPARQDKERKLIALMGAFWQHSLPSHEDESLWQRIAHDTSLNVDDAKKMWEDLLTEFMRHLQLPEPRAKWRFENEMEFCVPFLKLHSEKTVKTEEEAEGDGEVLEDSQLGSAGSEEEGEEDSETLPLALCQVECPDSPNPDLQSSGNGSNPLAGAHHDTLFEFFINMARTTATFPPQLQAYVKSEVFRAVNSAEIQLHASLAQAEEQMVKAAAAVVVPRWKANV